MRPDAAKHRQTVPARAAESAIRFIRNQHVVFDSDLAALYGVETRALVQAVKRNRERFPDDFLFQLDAGEFAALQAQSGTAGGRGGRRSPPWAFTEHGALMAASVLSSPRAVEASVFVVRAFVRMRRLLVTQRELARRLGELERRVVKQDASIAALFDAVRRLMQLPAAPRRLPGPGGRDDA
ncbi:MAG: ORF6N domain-containing protein [bacterium]